MPIEKELVFVLFFYKERETSTSYHVKHTCEYRPVDQLIGARSSPHDTRLANQEEQHWRLL